ncbi:MAG TPA: D-aminoacylase [Desulfobacterales bacterium]|nr:D-aminoacylase [Desulfobacterales bacterium]
MNAFLFKNATIVDGSGGPALEADVAVNGDWITQVGPVAGPAGEVIDASGLVLAPGFIDIHSHTDATVFENPSAASKLLQGVTLEVTGNCGLGCFPVSEDRRDLLLDFLKMHEFRLPAKGLAWTDMQSFAAEVEAAGIGLNLAPLVAHGPLRMAVMGSDDRPPEPGEMQAMMALLADQLCQGAWGFSTGLIYPPGCYAATDELIALAAVAAEHGAMYSSHIRGEASTLLDAVDEAIRIGRASGARVQVSHLKAVGPAHWGRGRVALERLAEARRAGVDIAADQYPYAASQTALSVLIPEWAHAGGVAAMLARIGDGQAKARLSAGIRAAVAERGGPERIRISGTGSDRNRALCGQHLAQVASAWGVPPEEAVVRLVAEEQAAVSAVFFSLSEDDLAVIVRSDTVAVGSDGAALAGTGDGGATHPRAFGTFPRVLGHFVRERKLLPLSTAVYKMTGLPAERLGLRDRGRIAAGFAADLVLFDPDAVADTATFASPRSYPNGIRMVIVNGRIAAQDGRPTAERPGRVLRRG